ncbi:Gmad2 immunoglobulin-like domain-containing protein [Kineococcus sp. SYSU DK004]|uniref:Gmad2 immunoglobulin-like domain-containing protein n=1 Tax=Kineococcus sp. SYSU DK004 TaxID=3383125 RepID=UPI003D7C6C18
MSGTDQPDQPDVPGTGPLPDPATDPTARALRGAMAARAAAVDPPDRLQEILMASQSSRRRTRAWTAVAAAAAVVVVGGSALALTQRGGDSVTTVAAATSATSEPAAPTSSEPASPTSEPAEPAPAPAEPTAATSEPAAPTSAPATSAPASAGSALPSGAASVPVYWLGGEGSPKLFREWVPVSGGADDATLALRALLGGSPADPDYASPFGPDAGASVTAADGRLVVDVAASAVSGDVETGDADLAVQQLVWTVTAAAGQDVPVELRVDGAAGQPVFGRVVAQAVSRAPRAEVQAPVWITGVSTSTPGSVTVEGTGTAFEGTLLWTVTDAAGTEVARDAVQAGANGTWGDFSFTAALPAGDYTVTVVAPDESGGEGAAPLPDTKTVTVR